MAKKKTRKAKKTFKKATHVRITDEERLAHLIRVSDGAITGKGGTVDEFFIQQAARLRRELEELKIKNELRKDLSKNAS